MKKKNKNKWVNRKWEFKERFRTFLEKSINKGFVDYAGAELDSILPPTSRRKGAREAKKQTVLQKIRNIVEIFIGI